MLAVMLLSENGKPTDAAYLLLENIRIRVYPSLQTQTPEIDRKPLATAVKHKETLTNYNSFSTVTRIIRNMF